MRIACLDISGGNNVNNILWYFATHKDWNKHFDNDIYDGTIKWYILHSEHAG